MATRRLSLTLFLLAPLISAQDYEEVQTPEPVSAVSGEHLPVGNNNRNKVQQEALEPWSPGEVPVGSTTAWETEEDVETTTWSTELQRVKHRAEEGEKLETAEQVLFRPIFRHRQMMADRLERQKQRNAERREAQASSFGAPEQLQVAQNRALASGFGGIDQNQFQYQNAKYTSLVPLSTTSSNPPKLIPVLVR